MKKLISIALAATLCMALTVPAAAITTGKWDFSGIHGAIQRVADEVEPEPPQETEKLPISDDVLAQIHSAIRAQRETAWKFWSMR